MDVKSVVMNQRMDGTWLADELHEQKQQHLQEKV
jgi:hypothetical protein